MKKTRAEMVDFITNIAMDLGQVGLGSSCGKYFNVLYFDKDNTIMVESFEKNDTYGFTNINDISDRYVKKMYEDLYEDFA